jgi:hypothetical protein
MKVGLWVALTFLALAQANWAPTTNSTDSADAKAAISKSSASYSVFGARPEQEAILRSQIQLMHPEALPARVLFVPHWKYVDNARIFQLHVPAGYGSVMFTHLPSRTIFIDNDRYPGEEWLGYWMAHELGHLKANSAKESDAEKAAHELRRCLRDAGKQGLF